MLRALPTFVFACTVLAPLAAQELRRAAVPMQMRGCFDPVRARVLAIGGDSYTREWDGSVWRRAPDRGAASFAFVYVGASGRAVQLRALQGTFTPSTNAFAVWRREGMQWQQLPIAGGPSPRVGMRLCHDPVHDVVVAFGGTDVTTMQAFDDTWTFDGTTWMQHTVATRPPAQATGAFVHDAARQRAVLAGGSVGHLSVSFDHWEWDGAAWTRPALPVLPPIQRPAGAYDPARQRIVFVGADANEVNQHWEYDGVQWTRQATLPAAMLAQTTQNQRAVLFGGLQTPLRRARRGRARGRTPSPRRSAGSASSQPAPPASWCRRTTRCRRSRSAAGTTAPRRRAADRWCRRAFDGVTWSPLAGGQLLPDSAWAAYRPRAVTSPAGRFTYDDAFGIAELLTVPARTAHYGSACTAAAPALDAAGLPIVGDATFALDATRLPANGIALLAAGVATLAVPVLGCTLLVDPVVTSAALASPRGHAQFGLPLPANPALVGVPFFCQAIAFAASAPAGFAFSDGLRVELGR
jgi:hypothetical protein